MIFTATTIQAFYTKQDLKHVFPPSARFLGRCIRIGVVICGGLFGWFVGGFCGVFLVFCFGFFVCFAFLLLLKKIFNVQLFDSTNLSNSHQNAKLFFLQVCSASAPAHLIILNKTLLILICQDNTTYS